MKKIKFYDENTKQWWTPVTGNNFFFFPKKKLIIEGGSNIPAINEILKNFNMSFGDKIYNGLINSNDIPSKKAFFSSGSVISSFPKDGSLAFFELRDQTEEILNRKLGNYTKF